MKFSKLLLLIYMIFLTTCVILPLFVLLYFAFTNESGQFSCDNFLWFFSNSKTIGTLLYSLAIAFITTLVCLFLAFPAAYFLTKLNLSNKSAILMVVVLPMWINFTLRITALKEVLTFLEGNMGYYPFFNTILGMTYDFLPFMIMPIYTVLLKMDSSLLEAANDLGATKLQVFFKIVIPLARPGIISGISMVFLPAMTNYVVLDMIYNSTYIMGSLIGSYFSSYDWHGGAMIATILLLFIGLFALIDKPTNTPKTNKFI